MVLYSTNTTLENVHSSIVDARAQAQVMFHDYFQNCIDKSKSIAAMDDILDGEVEKS